MTKLITISLLLTSCVSTPCIQERNTSPDVSKVQVQGKMNTEKTGAVWYVSRNKSNEIN